MAAAFAILVSSAAAAEPNPVEVGKVAWSRDFDAALRGSAESGKPVFALFQEVPGCAGCQKFGREVLSHPLIVEAIESEFVPVSIYSKLDLTPVQATNVNAWARVDQEKALSWLSPKQREQLRGE